MPVASRRRRPPTARAASPRGKRGRYHHGDLRRALLDAALAVLTEADSRALTLREVARRAGVTHAAPYRHFADKEALLAAVAEEGFRTLAETMREAMRGAGADEVERLEALGVGYVGFALAHPAHFEVMFGPELPWDEDRCSLLEAADATFALLLQSVQAGQAAGKLRGDGPLPFGLLAWSTVHGLATLLVHGNFKHVEDQLPPSAEALARQMTQDLTRGMRTSG
jgi:AcrR family transcriptional regulator